MNIKLILYNTNVIYFFITDIVHRTLSFTRITIWHILKHFLASLNTVIMCKLHKNEACEVANLNEVKPLMFGFLFPVSTIPSFRSLLSNFSE